MTNRLLPRVTSLALAALVTWSMLFGIDALTLHEHAANDLFAQAAALATTA
ncbi:MAG TPA: hypothetical protein VFQ16_11445 [Burkholderiaceae bacterium]|nr:hypothetical protein [Burkholderiaceae bacterium]